MANGSFRLTMAQGPTPGKVFELVKDILTIGRDVSNDVVINDAEVSRHHARLTRQVGGYMLEDLSSTNGTFVNGQRLIGPRPLGRGDTVGLGETVILGYEVVPAGDSGQATVVGAAVGSYPPAVQPQAQYAPPPPPVYAQPAPQPSYAPAAVSQPPPPAPRARGGGSRRNLYLGIGCGCLFVIVLCVAGIFALDAYAPDILYDPLGFLGF